jgi:hypothetical protein
MSKKDTPIDDSTRAQVNHFKLSKKLIHNSLAIDDLVGVVEAYRQRTYVEDITYLEDKLGGNSSFL